MKKRSSGILLHISSLPSAYGIGDLGPTAYQFADFLEEAGQHYWQILPLNPVNEQNGFSPYSSLSAFAGNTLFISPDILCHEGYVDESDLQYKYYFRDSSVDYSLAVSYKAYILDKAYEGFKRNPGDDKLNDYHNFCNYHNFWIDDYALFVALTEKFKTINWNQWPAAYRDRQPEALESARRSLKDSIDKEKFLQFVFFHQWYRLKHYCDLKKIHFIGDLPIYVSYDSSDVWAFPHIFKLDEKKNPITVSGVPPDYFSETGQLWGTPIFNWDLLKNQNYEWWMTRMGHNLSLFDMVRLDHFRAFSAYWEVPADHETAINGHWVKGPGADFFDHLKRRFPDLPLIAEDLGTIDDDVKDLIARFDLPGMKVLLFAFGPEMAQNPYILHNHEQNAVIYTGTHDNNTIRGWFENEASPEEKHSVAIYLQKQVDENNINDVLLSMALMSVGNLVIFPLQDAMGLGQESRMNIPSIGKGNWTWRFIPDQLTRELSTKLFNLMKIYNR
ncbi:MAG: 4-alpha-glucanotransferase [Candidatus Cyclobacteriaceae bacterium M3_2C_046]